MCGGIADATATLHPGDRINVTVFNHPELSVAGLQLDSEGAASLPLAGAVAAAGRTPRQLSDEVAARLSPFVRDPAVDIDLVSQGQNIFISGGPGGVLPYAPGETLSNALAQLHQAPSTIAASAAQQQQAQQQAATTVSTSASVTETVSDTLQYSGIDLTRVVIERDGIDSKPINAKALAVVGGAGPALEPGDTIKLRYKPIPVQVEGAVDRPGTVYLDSSEPLSDALLQEGGTDQASSSLRFNLTRSGQTETITQANPVFDLPAQRGDVLYVPRQIRIGVVGDVNKPGEVDLRGDSTLLSAVYYAGGPTNDGNIKKVTLVHKGTSQVYDLTDIRNGVPVQNPTVADGDTVFVPESHKFNFSLLFEGIIAAAQLRFL